MTIRALTLSVLMFALAATLPLGAEAAKNSNISCNVTASSKLVKPGDKVTISWKSSGAILSYGPKGEKIAPAGSMVVTPEKRTIYKFKFVGIGGNEKCGVRIRMEGDKVPA